MASRKEIKQAAVAAAKAEKERARARREELAQLPKAERKAAQSADRKAAKAMRAEAKKATNEARRGMTRKERRADKRAARITSKVRNRPRRAVGWGVFAAVVAVVGVIAVPYIRDVRALLATRVDTSTEAGVAARAQGVKVAEAISDEGIVLLKNEDDLLPLSPDSEGKKLNVFSFASFNLRYGGGGSGGADQTSAVSLYDALESQGIAYNQDLKSAMEDAGAKTQTENQNGLFAVVSMFMGSGSQSEPAPDYLSDEVMDSATNYASTALVVIGNDGVEAMDFEPEQLRLGANELALLDRVTQSFDDVIVVINSGNQMELGFLDDYPQIKSALWIGTPGPLGAVSLAKILTGEVTPSGHLSDTYLYDVTAAPAAQNFQAVPYDNAKRSFIDYEEGIYVGYRFFETYYFDDEAGYRQAVQFPFGFGLSYTDFDWQTSAPVLDGDQVNVTVKVTNTGAATGKDVVQVYYNPPYQEGGIEKSALVLGGYAKTNSLAPGESETVTISFPLRQMASWDISNGNYLLDAGTYNIRISTDVHTPVQTYPIEVKEAITYDLDEVTGTALENRFDEAEGDLVYLSRADWKGTYPGTSPASTTASAELLEQMTPEKTPLSGEAPITGVDNGIKLADLAGLDYDDPTWDKFLDQFTVNEQIDLFARGGWKTVPIERLGIPGSVLLDGPAGINFFFGEVTAASYPTAVVIASTWNDALAFDLGEVIGEEANAYGVQGWYAPAMNLHRTAQGGRNFEYYSEDPLLSGKMGAAIVAGAESRDVITFMKHFVLNDQESAARSGVNVFTNEQALRELYLRPFEITVKEGGASGAMSSFIHIGPTWSGGNPALLQEVLRSEWGFEGIVSTDAVLGSFMDPELAVKNGNELMLTAIPTPTVKQMHQAYKKDPVGIGQGLRDRTHEISYRLLQTDLFDDKD